MPRFAGGDHARHESDHAVDHPAEIDPDQPIKIAIGGFFDRPEAVHPGGVEKQGRGRAEEAFDLIGGLRIGGAVGDVEHDAMGLDPFAAQGGEGFFDCLGADVGDHDPRAGAAEKLRLTKARA